jgi:hypothetical protein
MITVRLLGGLGNQLFQAAFAMSLQDRGYHVQLDRSYLIEGTHREYSLGYFGILSAGLKAKGKTVGKDVYENGLRYNPSYLYPEDPCTMIGYWQSEAYFTKIQDKVRAAFKFPERSRLPYIAAHVRRQDYVGLEHFHGMPGLDYYRRAIAHIRREVGALVPVLVFSDDRNWCKQNFPDFEIAEGDNKYEDLNTMSRCEYHVIANSSYSWWGAYLGPQKLIVAPKQWFVTQELDSTGIVPEAWVRL